MTTRLCESSAACTLDGARDSSSCAGDLLYGLDAFRKLPEWMTSPDDSEDDDDEDVPYGHKFGKLLAGAYDDGETTSPPSEPLAELSSGSDDELASGAKSPAESATTAPGAKSPAELPATAQISGNSTRSSDRREFWRSDVASSATAEEEDDDGLVDLDPEEGRRRGAILLALLNEKPSSAAAEEIPSPPPGAPRPSGSLKAAAQPVQIQLSGWASTGGAAGASGSVASAPASCAGKAATHAAYASIVCEAACRAFGSGAVDVASSASGGFVVWLCGWAGAELQQSGHQAVLDMLSQALWPYLGQDIMGVEQRTTASAAGSSGARLSGVASAVAGTRLTLWCLAEEAQLEQSFCWQYVRSGVCPRGALCRWRHSMPPTYPIDIEVAAA